MTDSLTEALADLAETGRTTPCQREPGPFLSDDPHERREAASACQMCPILDPCRTHAETLPEVWLVWGGIDRRTQPARKKT